MEESSLNLAAQFPYQFHFFKRALHFLSLSLAFIFTRLPVSFLAVPSFLFA